MSLWHHHGEEFVKSDKTVPFIKEKILNFDYFIHRRVLSFINRREDSLNQVKNNVQTGRI